MKVLVLGNSNSIVPGGYIGGLLAQLPAGTTLTNRSIGHSPGTQFAHYGAMDFAAFDLVIFDSIANDEIFVEDVGGWEIMRDLYYELFSTIASQTRLVVVGFFRRALDAPVTDVHHLQDDLARLLGVPFIDVRKFILKHGRAILPKGAPLMRDEAHPPGAVVQQLGHYIGRLVLDSPPPRRDSRNFAANFAGIEAPEHFGGPVRSRHTGLTTRRLAILRAGDALEFDVEKSIVGFYVDISMTRGLVGLEGSHGTLTKAMLFDDRNLGLQMRFIPTRAPFPTRRLVCAASADTYQPSLHSRTPGVDDPSAVVSLQGIACWSGGRHDDLPIKRRGAITHRPARRRMRASDDVELQAPDLPVVSGWSGHAIRPDGMSSRATGPETPSVLAFDFQRGRYAIELRVLGAISHEALTTLRLSAGGRELAVETAFDVTAGFFRCSTMLDVEKAGPIDLNLTVPLMKLGVGLEVAGIRLTGDREAGGALKAYRAVRRLVSAARS